MNRRTMINIMTTKLYRSTITTLNVMTHDKQIQRQIVKQLIRHLENKYKIERGK